MPLTPVLGGGHRKTDETLSLKDRKEGDREEVRVPTALSPSFPGGGGQFKPGTEVWACQERVKWA